MRRDPRQHVSPAPLRIPPDRDRATPALVPSVKPEPPATARPHPAWRVSHYVSMDGAAVPVFVPG